MSVKKDLTIQKVISKDECSSEIRIMKFPSFDSICGINDNKEKKVSNIEEQAKILLEQTQRTCEEMITKAHIEAENIKKDAFQSGYNSGIEVAKKEFDKTIQNTTQALVNAVNQLSSIKDEIIKNAEKDIIELTLAIARKLVCSELRQNPDLIIEIIKEAIKAARTDDEIVIKLNPQDRILLEQNSKQITDYLKSATFNPTMKITFEDDQSIEKGGCIVVTAKNIFDMTFESRFESILPAIYSKNEE